MLDQKPLITEERVVGPAPPAARRAWWLAGLVAFLVVGLIITAVVLIGDGETAQTAAYQYEPLRPGSGFFEGLDPGRLPVTAAAATQSVAPAREYLRIGDRSGMLEGLDGPVSAIAVSPTREYLRIADRSGTLEGLDGPLTSIAVAPAAATSTTGTYQPLRPGSGFFEGLDPGTAVRAPTRDYVRIGDHSGHLEGLD